MLSLLYLKKNKKINNDIFLIIFFFIYNYFYYYSSFKNLIVNLNSYENKIWNYVHILNNNNNSLIFFFMLIILLIFYFNINKIINIKYTYILFFSLIFINLAEKKTIIFNYFFLSIKFINIILNNGIILIHPLCMYITYCLFLIFIVIYLKKIKKNWFLINLLSKTKKYLIFFSFNALFLGSYWAQQELNW
jgi:hypothetical protein